MPYFQKVGDVPRTRHTQFRQPSSELYHEELIGEEGFVGDSTLLYHRNLPANTLAIEQVTGPTATWVPNHPLLPRHLKPQVLEVNGDLVTGRVPLLGNEDVVISFAVSDTDSPLYRNALGDELVYVQSGTAEVDTVMGRLSVGPGDYVVMPTATTHRWRPTGTEPLRALIVEARGGHVNPPSRYLSKHGQFLESAPFCELDLRLPDGPLVEEGAAVDVVYKNRNGYSRYTMACHPFDVVGWFGCMYPYVFSVRDFSPVTGSIHRPPPVHQTFEGPRFVVCNFVPRLFDYAPGAVPVPPFHANVDSDEVLFYAEGSFMSRKGSGIGEGSISLHPAGFIHGPHPGSVEAALGATATEETAIMVDTFAPLLLSADAFAIEDPDYFRTWNPERHASGA